MKNLEQIDHDEPQMEHDEYVETEQQMKDDEFVCGKQIQDKVDLIEHINFLGENKILGTVAILKHLILSMLLPNVI